MDIGAIQSNLQIPQMENFFLPCPLQNTYGIQIVADLIDHNALDWNYRLLHTLFPL